MSLRKQVIEQARLRMALVDVGSSFGEDAESSEVLEPGEGHPVV